jgi:hypothetical protein
MSNDDQILALYEAANERWGDDTLREPKATSWGMYSYGDAPAAIGGGMGAFTWFDNKTSLLKFVAEVLPFCPPGPRMSDPLAVDAKVREVLAGVRAGDIDLEKARRKLNVVLRSYSQIEWIGTFKGLKDGDGTYARKLVKEFRRSCDLPVGAAPVAITRSQVEDFKEFLAEYGI